MAVPTATALLCRGQELVKMEMVLAKFPAVIASSDFSNAAGWTNLAGRLNSNPHRLTNNLGCKAVDYEFQGCAGLIQNIGLGLFSQCGAECIVG